MPLRHQRKQVSCAAGTRVRTDFISFECAFRGSHSTTLRLLLFIECVEVYVIQSAQTHAERICQIFLYVADRICDADGLSLHIMFAISVRASMHVCTRVLCGRVSVCLCVGLCMCVCVACVCVCVCMCMCMCVRMSISVSLSLSLSVCVVLVLQRPLTGAERHKVLC